MRLENMVWRMMPDQFDQFVHGGAKTRVDVDKKLKQLKEDYKRFLGPEHNVALANAKLTHLISAKLEGVVPKFFQHHLKVAPLRRVTEMLVYGCLAQPFTELELLMHTVSFFARFENYQIF